MSFLSPLEVCLIICRLSLPRLQLGLSFNTFVISRHSLEVNTRRRLRFHRKRCVFLFQERKNRVFHDENARFYELQAPHELLCTFCSFSRGACVCFAADVIYARRLVSGRRCRVMNTHTHTHTTSMAAVGFCGEWFVFSGGSRLVAVHIQHSRSGTRLSQAAIF